eukprot:gene40443-49291_t
MLKESQISDRSSQKIFRQTPPTFYQLIRKKGHEALLGFVPVVGHIPPTLRLFIGTLYIFLLIAGFVALFVSGYYSERNNVFLSPLNGTQPSDNCNLVPQEHSGRFLATSFGSWQRESNFLYPNATYALYLQATRWTQEDFAAFMAEAYDSLREQGRLAVGRPLDYAVLTWLGWTHTRAAHPQTRIGMHADARVLFQRDFSVAGISNASMDCGLPGLSADYVSTTGQLTAVLPMAGYSAACRNMLDPRLLGYDSLARPAQFVLGFDARALGVAAY